MVPAAFEAAAPNYSELRTCIFGMFWQVFPEITDFSILCCRIFSKLYLALCLLGSEFQDSWIAEKTRTNGKIPKVSDFRKFSGLLQIRSHMEVLHALR